MLRLPRVWPHSPPEAIMASPPPLRSNSTIASAGGAWQQAQRNAWYTPFAQKMGIKFNEEETSAGMARVQAMVQAHNVTRSTWSPSIRHRCWRPATQAFWFASTGPRSRRTRVSSPARRAIAVWALDVYGDILAYNTEVVKSDPPTTVLALFDTQRWPGKRGMQKIATNNLEWALEADGVPIDQVYKVLATSARRRPRLRQARHHQEGHRLVAGRRPTAAVARVAEVVMTTAWNGRIQNPIDHEHAPFKIVWTNEIIEYDMISIPKGSPHLDLAYKYLAYVAQPENNARLGQFIPYGPVVKDAVKYVPPEALPKLPTAPDHLNEALPVDMEFWADYGQELTKRFNEWLAK